MRLFRSAAVLAALLSLPLGAARADESFPGVAKAMPAETYRAAGLARLTATERAALDEWIRGYTGRRTQEAARNAGKEKANAITESKIVGSFTGYNDRSVIVLENGAQYRVSQGRTSFNQPVESPRVFLIPTMLGMKMFIPATGDEIRVVKVN